MMRLLLTVDDGDRAADIEDGATVDDLVLALGLAPGSRLRVARSGEVLAGPSPLFEADLRNGDQVTVADPGPTSAAGSRADRRRARRRTPAAVLRLLGYDGPDTMIELPFGRTTIGRGDDNDVVVDDAAMSRAHAVIEVDDETVTVHDLGSRNGVVVSDDARSGVTALGPGRRALLGNTWIEVDHLRRPRGLDDVAAGLVPFNRPPRRRDLFQPPRIALPTPPGRPQRARLPMVSALAPLLMGAAMVYAPVLFGGRPNYLFGLFTVFSPVMAVASYLESRRSGRSQQREELSVFRQACFDLELQLEALLDVEVAARRDGSPPASELPTIVQRLSPRLWERGVDDGDVLRVRIGLADQGSQIELQRPVQGRTDLLAELDDLVARFATVPAVPVVADLVDGGLGIWGPSDLVRGLAWSVVTQLASLHSPAELVLAAMLPSSETASWEWLKWLPHCAPEGSPLAGPVLADTEVGSRRLLASVNALIDARLQRPRAVGEGPLLIAPLVVVVVAEGVPVEQHELTHLVEHGPSVGVATLWLAGASRRVPRPVGTVVELQLSERERAERGGPSRDPSVLATVSPPERSGPVVRRFEPELIDRAQAERVARLLSPVTDVAARMADEADIPARVSLVDILGGPDLLDDADIVAARWAVPTRSLAAPIGRLTSEPFTLDIRRDGPHCLVAGTTGAGKSELLQTWIASMAVSHGPDKVNFLLVDYKGGAAFKDCALLPHAVGMVTDLDGAGVNRALISLRAELNRRERVLHANGCSDLVEMLEQGLPDAPPSLLIIVDEFAALVQEVPEFVEGVVGVAQRGRSLGLHLVLATQRPAGIITGQVKANTDLRIALRVADREDSTDVIDVPDASAIERSLPGRAIARIGPRDRFSFQTAYVGGVTGSGNESLVRAHELGFGRLEPIVVARPAAAAGPIAATDLERLVATIGRAHANSGQPLPRRPWLEPLAPSYDLAAVVSSIEPASLAGPAVVLGMADQPARQAQQPLLFHPENDGSLAVIGAGGAGKTVVLRTLAAAVALGASSPDDIPHVYGLDFAGRGLRMIDALPHVGSVIAEDDPERVRRLLADLGAELDRRADLFARAGAASLSELSAAQPNHRIRRLYLLVDGYPAFHQAHDGVEQDRWLILFRRLVTEGRPFGIHVVLTAPRRETIYSTVARAMGRWLVLRQTHPDDYRNLEVPLGILHADSPPGRAVEQGQEAQVAVLGGQGATESQVRAVQTLAEALTARGVEPAPPVRLLPLTVRVRELGDPRAVALRDRDFAPWLWPDQVRSFLVAGPRLSGRSTTLVTMGRAAHATPGTQVHYLASKAAPGDLDSRFQVRVGPGEVGALVEELLYQTGAGGGSGAGSRQVVLIDNANELQDAGLPIDQLVERADGHRLVVVGALDAIVARRTAFDPLARALTANRAGLLLQPSPLEDGDVFAIPLARVKSQLWPPGRGYLVSGPTVEVVQVAVS